MTTTPARLVRTATSGQRYKTDFVTLEDWDTLGAGYAPATSRPGFVCKPSPVVLLAPSSSTSARDHRGHRESFWLVAPDGNDILFSDWLGDGSGSDPGDLWAGGWSKCSDGSGNFIKQGLIPVNLAGAPSGVLTATSPLMITRYNGQWVWSSVLPTAYNAGIPGGFYENGMMVTATGGDSDYAGPYSLLHIMPVRGGTGTFNQQINGLTGFKVNADGTITGYCSARELQTSTGTVWRLNRVTGANILATLTDDGQGGAMLSNVMNNAAGCRPENPWELETDLNRSLIAANSVNPGATGDDGFDLIFGFNENQWSAVGSLSPIFSDTFAGSGTLAGHNGWSEPVSAGGSVTYSSGIVSLPTGSAANKTVCVNSGTSDASPDVAASLSVPSGNAGIGLVFSYVDSSNYKFVDFEFGSAGGIIALYEVISGTQGSAQGSITPSGTLIQGTTYACSIQVTGSTVNVFIGSSLMTSIPIGSGVPPTGLCGFNAGGGGTSVRSVSNFVVSNGSFVTNAYRTRALRLVPSDTTTSFGLGVCFPQRTADNQVVKDDAGRVGCTYDANGTDANVGRSILGAVLCPTRGALYCNKSSGVSRANKTFTHGDGAFAFVVEALQAGSSQEFHFRSACDAVNITSGYSLAWLSDGAGSTTLTLYKVVGGSYTPLSPTGVRVALPTVPNWNNSYLEKVMIALSGNTINIYWDSTTPVITYVDSSSPILSGPQFGFGSGSANQTMIKDFSFEPSQSVTITGLPHNTQVTLKLANIPMIRGTSDGSGSLTVLPPYFPITAVNVNGIEAKPYGDIGGGDTLAYIAPSGGGSTLPPPRHRGQLARSRS